MFMNVFIMNLIWDLSGFLLLLMSLGVEWIFGGLLYTRGIRAFDQDFSVFDQIHFELI